MKNSSSQMRYFKGVNAQDFLFSSLHEVVLYIVYFAFFFLLSFLPIPFLSYISVSMSSFSNLQFLLQIFMVD